MNKILCVGEALIDMICTDKGRSLSDGDQFIKKAGGAPANVAAAIAALGGHVALVAKVGNDPFGKHLIDTLRSFSVNTDWILQDDQHFTTFAFVSLLENGERDFYFNRGADGQLNRQESESIDLHEFSIIHFGSATGFLPGALQTTYRELLERAIQKNVYISFDPNYRHLLFKDRKQSFIDQSWKFLTACHFFKVSDEEALLLTGCGNLQDAALVLLDKTNAVFAITLGSQGTLLGMNGKTTIIESIPVTPVDTTGAGDAFVGAVLYQLAAWSDRPGLTIQHLTENDWHKIILNGNKAGARTCEYLGAMEAFRHLSSDIFK